MSRDSSENQNAANRGIAPNNHRRAPGFHGVDMTSGPILPKTLVLAWPIVVSSLLQMTVSVADIYMVGRLGSDSIASVGIARSVIFIMFALAMAVATGVQVLVAQYRGKRDADGMEAVTKQGLLVSIPATLLLMSPVGILTAGIIMRAMGATPEVMALGVPYMQLVFAGMVLMVVSFIVTGVLQGAGDTLTPLLLLIVANVLNILVNYVCIFGWGPVAAMGVTGAAVGTLVARFVTAVAGIAILFSGRFAVRVRLRGSWKFNFALITRIFYIGIPAGLQQITRNLGMMAIFKILTLTAAGMAAVSAFTVASQVRMIGIMIGLAMMAASTTAVGQNVGAGNVKRAEHAAWLCSGIAAVISVVLAATYALLRRDLIGLFSDEPDVIRIGAEALLILAISEPFITSGMSLGGALRGAGDTWSPLFIAFVNFAVLAPIGSYVMAIAMHMQTRGVWLGLNTGFIVAFFLLAAKFRSGAWKKLRLT